MHDNTTNQSRITINTAGLYLIQGASCFDSNPTGNRICKILLNGTIQIGYSGISGSSSAYVNVSSIYRLAQGDYLELSVNQSSGGDLSVGFGATTFTAVKLGD